MTESRQIGEDRPLPGKYRDGTEKVRFPFPTPPPPPGWRMETVRKVPILKPKGKRGQEGCSEKLVRASKKEKQLPPLAFCWASTRAGLILDPSREEQEVGIGDTRTRSLIQHFRKEHENVAHP